MPAKLLTKDAALLKMAALCARSEQSSFEIARKLRSRGLSLADTQWVIQELKDRKFVDDNRFARSFTNDKVRFSSWGRMKIRMALKAKGIGDDAILAAFEEVDPQEYAAVLKRVARAKAKSLDLSVREDKIKLYRHLLSRGFESYLVLKEIRNWEKGIRN